MGTRAGTLAGIELSTSEWLGAGGGWLGSRSSVNGLGLELGAWGRRVVHRSQPSGIGNDDPCLANMVQALTKEVERQRGGAKQAFIRSAVSRNNRSDRPHLILFTSTAIKDKPPYLTLEDGIPFSQDVVDPDPHSLRSVRRPRCASRHPRGQLHLPLCLVFAAWMPALHRRLVYYGAHHRGSRD